MLHIALSKSLNFPTILAEAEADRAPNHILLNLAEKIPLTFHIPGAPPLFADPAHPPRMPHCLAPAPALTPTLADNLRAKLFPPAHLWAHARKILQQTAPTDTIYATGEDIGLPLAVLAKKRKNPPKLTCFIHNINRPRAKALLALHRPLKTIHTFFSNTDIQLDFLNIFHHIPQHRLILLPEQIDTQFFRPPAELRTQDSRLATPLIVSVGLEQRDYKTLAAATHDLPVTVKISGFSKDARAMANAFPNPLPQNMTRQFYDWPALRALYHQATLVLVPVLENPYCAGLTAYLEAAACQKPVIISRTSGLNPLLTREADIQNACLTVPPQDPQALRAAIQSLLENPARAAQLATTAHATVHSSHTPTDFLNTLLPHLT
jgi:glycosyltransferase involved in cell wall biosynthesis